MKPELALLPLVLLVSSCLCAQTYVPTCLVPQTVGTYSQIASFLSSVLGLDPVSVNNLFLALFDRQCQINVGLQGAFNDIQALKTQEGIEGHTLPFSGVNGYEVANSVALHPGAQFTAIAWVSVAAANPEISAIIDKWTTNIDDEYLLGLDSTNHVKFGWQTSGNTLGGSGWHTPSYNFANSNAIVPLNTWTHIAVVRDGPAISFFVNGVLDTTLTVADNNPFRPGLATVRVGAQNRGDASGILPVAPTMTQIRLLTGRIAQPMIYNRALASTEVMSLANTLPIQW